MESCTTSTSWIDISDKHEHFGYEIIMDLSSEGPIVDGTTYNIPCTVSDTHDTVTFTFKVIISSSNTSPTWDSLNDYEIIDVDEEYYLYSNSIKCSDYESN